MWWLVVRRKTSSDSSSSSGQGLVRITVKADGKMAHANDLGVSTKALPAYIVSTLSQHDDGYNHFAVKKYVVFVFVFVFVSHILSFGLL